MKKKILVLGGTGLLGYHTTLEILKHDYDVVSISLPPMPPEDLSPSSMRPMSGPPKDWSGWPDKVGSNALWSMDPTSPSLLKDGRKPGWRIRPIRRHVFSRKRLPLLRAKGPWLSTVCACPISSAPFPAACLFGRCLPTRSRVRKSLLHCKGAPQW